MPTPLLALALLMAQSETPRLLIAPLAPAKKDGPLPSASLGNHLAAEFDTDGRATAVVWGLTDPIFRPAALDGKLGNVPVLPNREQALDAGRKLGARYVLLFRSERKEGKLDASAELLIDGRSVWKDAKNMGAQLNGEASDDDTAASVARTWMLLMTTGPLKDLNPKKVATTPNATEGQGPTTTEVATAPPPVTTDVAALDAQIEALSTQGKPLAALALARDAVDADPLSSGPRGALVRLLARQGDAKAAAEEARRAADLLPEATILRIDAVRRLVAVGRLRDAHEEMNEYRARFPEDPAGRRLAAEVALADGDAETAVRELEPLFKTGEDPEAHLLRSLARARLGGTEGATADMRAWAGASLDSATRMDGYVLARRTLSADADRAANALLPLLQRAAAQPKAGAVRDELDDAQRQAQARAGVWDALSAPAEERKNYDAWALAHRLMALVAADLRAYLAGSDDALTSARIDLGEAQRAMKTARGG